VKFGVHVWILYWGVEVMKVASVTVERLAHIDPSTAQEACLIYRGAGATMMIDGEFEPNPRSVR
jgi:type IV secretory pathway TrbD component